MIKILWNTLELCENYDRTLRTVDEELRIVQRLTHISLNVDFSSNKN